MVGDFFLFGVAMLVLLYKWFPPMIWLSNVGIAYLNEKVMARETPSVLDFT